MSIAFLYIAEFYVYTSQIYTHYNFLYCHFTIFSSLQYYSGS